MTAGTVCERDLRDRGKDFAPCSRRTCLHRGREAVLLVELFTLSRIVPPSPRFKSVGRSWS